MTDWGALYREHVADISALAGSLTPEQLLLQVSASPDWTVHEVYAHLAGVASDTVTGRTDGAPGPPWTEQHVAERRQMALPAIVTELGALQDDVVGTFGEGPPGTVFDMATHHADLHEALGKHQLAEPLWRPVLEAMGDRVDATAFADVPPYEQFRAVFSRRSRAQMQAWGTPLGPDQLDEVGVFGPRDDDQPIPSAD